MRMLRGLATILSLILFAVACGQSSGTSSPTAERLPEATVEQGRQGPPGQYVEVEPTIVGDPLVVNQFIQRLEELGLKTAAIETQSGMRVQYCLDAPRRSYEIACG